MQFVEWQAPSALACRALAAVEDFLMQLQKRLEEGAFVVEVFSPMVVATQELDGCYNPTYKGHL